MDIARGVDTAKAVAAALAACALLGIAACATTTRGSLVSSSDRLESDTEALARDARDTEYPADFRADTDRLADAAHEFRRTVEDSSASDADVRAAFDRLGRAYHRVRDEVKDSDSGRAHEDLRPVTNAYLDIENQMGGHPPERHASVD
jgi:hypothetical protein